MLGHFSPKRFMRHFSCLSTDCWECPVENFYKHFKILSCRFTTHFVDFMVFLIKNMKQLTEGARKVSDSIGKKCSPFEKSSGHRTTRSHRTHRFRDILSVKYKISIFHTNITRNRNSSPLNGQILRQYTN